MEYISILCKGERTIFFLACKYGAPADEAKEIPLGHSQVEKEKGFVWTAGTMGKLAYKSALADLARLKQALRHAPTK